MAAAYTMEPSTPDQPGPQAVRQQLKRLLENDLFSHAPRQCRFLTHIVEATIGGESERLSQFAIGFQVFDRDETFDPSTDAIVRVEAGRLRSKLSEYYGGPGRDDPILITLPRGGYSVSFEQRGAVQASTSTSGSQPTRANPVVAVLLVLAIAGGLYTAFDLLPDRQGKEPPDEGAVATTGQGPRAVIANTKPTIAVMPFDNMSSDPDQDYFSDGITEDIITDLSLVSGLRVIARHSTFVYKGRAVTIKTVGNDLGAHYVLEGSVRKDGDQLRITAQLIDVATETHLWAERYDRTLDDIFATQDEVSQSIVQSLGVQLTDLETNRIAHEGTRSIEAHDAYLRARDQFYLFTEEGVNRAIELFSQATALDPGYAEAFAWQSRAVTYTVVAGMDGHSEEPLEQALALARRAIELDEELSMAHANLAWALRWRPDIESAIASASRAIELNPNFAEAYLWQSLILSTAGHGEAARVAVEKGMLLDPHHSVTYVFALGRAHFVLGEVETALYHYDRGIERNPNFLPNHTHKMLTLERLGRTAALEAAKAELVRIAPDYQQSAAYRVYKKLQQGSRTAE